MEENFSKPSKSTMFKNIAYLALVQVSNFVFPVITLPYLVRTLGVSDYGSIMLSLAIVQYFSLVVDYGFNYSATREIAIAKSKKEINSLFSRTILAKTLLLVISLVLYSIYCIFFAREGNSWVTFSFALVIIGNCYFPLFFFQAIEKMKVIATLSILSKFLCTVWLFTMVKDSGDVFNAAYFYGLNALLPSIFSFVYIYSRKLVSFELAPLSQVRTSLKRGSAIFISQISISFYTTFNVILLGFFYPPAVVGYFSAAERMRAAVQSCFVPIQQVVFPRINKEIKNFKHRFKIYTILYLSLAFLVSLFIFFFGQQLAIMYLGKEFTVSGHIFKEMSLLVFIVCVAVCFGNWGLITLGYASFLTKLYVCFSLLHLCYAVPLVYFYSYDGLIWSVILTEFLITICIVCKFQLLWSRLNLKDGEKIYEGA